MENEYQQEENFKDKFFNSQNAGAKVFINSIFHKNKNESYTCLLREEQYLVNLFYLLLECEDKEVIELLEFISFILKQFPQNAEVFMKISLDNRRENNSFLTILIKKYLTSNCEELLKILKDLIEFLINNVEFDKSSIEFIFQELSVCYRFNQTILNDFLLNKFLNLLKLLLGEKLSYSKPKNYFYLSGSSCIKINDKILDEERIKLSNGAVFSFWFNIAKFPTEKTENISTIMRLKTNKSLQLELNLNVNKLTLRNFTKFEYNLPDGWNFLTFLIKPKNFFRDAEYIFIVNNEVFYYKLPDFECDCDVKELVFFENFIGQISSIMFLNKFVSEDCIKQLKEFKYGFYSEKKLFQLLKNCNNNYMNNSNFHFKNFLLTKEFVGLNNIVDNLKILYTPSRYNENNLYDAIGKYHAQIISKSKFQNSVRTYYCFQKDIFYLGGIRNFIPLFELIYTKDLFTETTLINYLELIQIIVNSRIKNIRNCIETNFFSMLSLFFEKLHHKLFTDNLIIKLLEIGKYLLSINDNLNEYSNQYFEYILLNETIFTKFPVLLQIFLWKNINEYFLTYTHHMKSILKIRKLLILVSLYLKKSLNIMIKRNIMKSAIQDIIRITICEVDDEKCENMRLLMNYLSLDNSLCIQKGIIDIFYYYFLNEKDELVKHKKLSVLIEYKIFEVITYVYSISTIDIKCVLINVFKEMSSILYKDPIYFKIFSDKIISFLVDHTFTDNLLFNEHKDSLEIHNVELHPITSLNDKSFEPGETNELKKKLFSELSESNPIIQEDSSILIESIKNKKEITSIENPTENTINKKYLIHKELSLEFKQSQQEKYFSEIKRVYNADIYNKYVQDLYLNLFKWLLNTNESSSKHILALFDDNDFIVNHYVINIMVNSINYTNIILLQRFFQDIHLLLMNNRENCINLFKNNTFYIFLLEVTYKNYVIMNNDSEDLDGSAIAIYDLGKKIHTEIILNTMLKDESLRSEPMSKINFLLNWAIKFKTNSANYDLNCFLRSLLRDLLILIVDIIKSISPNLKSVIWENFANLSILIYEFMTFHNLSYLLVNENIIINEINMDNIIVPRLIFSSLNLERDCPNSIISPSNRKRNSILNIKPFDSKNQKTKDLWMDYILFEKIYSSLSHIWSLKFFEVKELNYRENKRQIFEIMVDEYIGIKKQKDVFINYIKLFFQTFKIDGEITYDNNLIKTFSNLFGVTISIIHDSEDIILWLDEYERFIIFFIIASCNLKNTGSNFFNLVNETIADIVCFAICFLSDELFHTRKGSQYEKYFFDSITNILTFLILMYDFYFNKIYKKKNFSELINSSVKLNKNNDITNSACFKIFSYLLLNGNNEEAIKFPSINEIKSKEELKKYVSDLYLNEYWILAVFDNSRLKKRFKLLFDFNVYSTILKYRIKANYSYQSIMNETKLEPLILSSLGIIDSLLIGHVASYLELEFKKYYNSLFNDEKNKIYLYKTLKKKLFQWRGMWSDKKVYYHENHKLKFKISNHLTSYFSRPLLIPILDIDYYLPSFTKFNSNTLFLNNENNLKYTISLDIDKILKKLSNTECEEINQTKSIKENYLGKIYKNVEVKIKEVYQSINQILYENIKSHKQYELFPKIKIASDPKFLKFESVFDCCYVKLSHHIRGYFQITTEGIYLRPFKKQFQKQDENFDENEVFLNLEDYDIERQTCYGSILSFHHKEKDIILYFWPIREIKMILKRRYYFKKKAFEIFTVSNKSYFFSFKNQTIRDAAINLLSSYFLSKREIKLDTKESKDKSDINIGFEQLTSTNLNTSPILLSHKIEKWVKWKISNFELLMWLNFLGNRSYNDISQYPVFPWLVKNYRTEELNPPSDLRELNIPMGMIETENKKSIDRKKKYVEEYRESGLYSDKHRHYGSHYSNPLYISHYLTRLFPLVQTHIELQGDKFDDPNRLFFSISNSFQSATTQQGDVRELTPEFFFLPEMFININNLNMGKRYDEIKSLIPVLNVEIPQWAGNDPYQFVCDMKRILESDYVSSRIGEWIDLIFGLKQTGKEAELSGNVFDYLSYENCIDLDKEDKSKKSFYMRSAEFGLTPTQLFYKSFPIRQPKEKILKGTQISEKKDLKIYKNSQKYPKVKVPIMLLMQMLENEKLMCIYNNNTVNLYKFQLSDNKFNITVENKTFFSNDMYSKINFKIHLCSENSYNSPCVIFNNGKVIVQGGYYDGRISVSYSEGNLSKCFNYYTNINFPITALAIDKKEHFLYAGNTVGCLYVYKINESQLFLQKIIYDHTDQISYIAFSDTLNIVATSSLDGYANLYTYPKTKLFRSSSSDPFSIDYIFLSAYPLPSFIIYSKENKNFTSISINGKILFNEEEDCKYLLSPHIFNNISFDDYLIYGTVQCEIKIRKLPSLNLVKKVNLSENISKNNIYNSVKCIELNKDKKFIFLWKTNDIDVTILKDPY